MIVPKHAHWLTVLMLWVAGVAAVGCSRGSNPDKYVESADRYFANREYEKAKIEYLSALRLQPTNTTAIVQLGKIFFRQGQLRESAPFLIEGRKRAPGDLELANNLGIIYVAVREFAKARAEAEAVLALSPTNELALLVLADTAQTPAENAAILQAIRALEQRTGPRASFHVARAQLALRLRDTATAESELKQAIALDSKSVMARQILGNLRWSAGQVEAAEQEFRAAAQLAPPDDSAHYRLATFLKRTGKLEEAKKVLDEINRTAPERTAAWVERAEIALAEKQFEECARLINRALSQAPGDIDAKVLQAQLKLNEKKPAEAVEILEKVVEQRPQSGDIRYQLAMAQLINQQLPAAIANLTQATELDTNNISAALMLAQLNLARGQASSAVSTLTDIVRRAPNLERAQLMLAQAFNASGRPDDAGALFRAMRTRFPSNALVAYQHGIFLRSQRQNTEAVQALEVAQRLAPNEIEPLDQLIGLDLAATNSGAARKRLQPALERQPNSAPLWVLRARIDAADKNKEAAVQALEKAIELSPEYQPAYMLLANLHLGTGAPKDALENLDALLAKNATNVTALTLKGMVHAQLGDQDSAMKAYEDALKINPNFVLGLNNLAVLLAEHRKQLPEAVAMATKARQLAPEDPAVADTLGWIEYRRGNYPEAARLLSEARDKLPQEPEIAYHAGMTQYMMGNQEAAKQALTLAVQSSAQFNGKAEAEQRLALLTQGAGRVGPDQIAALEKLRQDDPKDFLTVLRLGNAYEVAQQWDKARDAYEAAFKLNPAGLEAVSRLAALEVDRNAQRANELARQAQKLSPSDPGVSHTLGRLALKSGDAATALGLLQSSARGLTNQPAVWRDLAIASFANSRLKEAVEQMNYAVRLGLPVDQAESAKQFVQLVEYGMNPASSAQLPALIEAGLKSDLAMGPALYANGLTLEMQGKFKEAQEAHDKLLQRYPTFILSTRQLAILYADRLNNDAKAYELATKARTALPKDDALARTLGGLALRRGDYRYAVQLLSEVARNQPKDAQVQFQLGVAQLRLKQLPEARVSLEKAIALDPKAAFVPEAKKLLEENKAG